MAGVESVVVNTRSVIAMKMMLDANYCPKCGRELDEAYRLTANDDEGEMRKAAVDIADGCVVFYGSTRLGQGETQDFSEIGRMMGPHSAEVYKHA